MSRPSVRARPLRHPGPLTVFVLGAMVLAAACAFVLGAARIESAAARGARGDVAVADPAAAAPQLPLEGLHTQRRVRLGVAAAGARDVSAAPLARVPDQPGLSGRTAAPPIPTQTGRASWYGEEFAGQRTASGQVFDPGALTCAHRELPFGTLVRVTNLANGASVVVTVTDRGPYSEGRIIDLSSAAADAIGMKGAGTASVRLEVIDS